MEDSRPDDASPEMPGGSPPRRWPAQQPREPGRGAGGAVGLHGDVVDLPADLSGQHGREVLLVELLVGQVRPGAVLVEPGPHVEVLLEVVAERDVMNGTGTR